MIKYYRKMKNVDRLSTTPKIRNYNLLEHSFMVAVLFKDFASKCDISYGISEFNLILNHDLPEVETTDLIYSVKNHSENTKEYWSKIENEILHSHPKLKKYSEDNISIGLTELQYKLFKVCDLLDLWIFCKEESSLGNNNESILKVTKKCEELIYGKFKKVDEFMANFKC